MRNSAVSCAQTHYFRGKPVGLQRQTTRITPHETTASYHRPHVLCTKMGTNAPTTHRFSPLLSTYKNNRTHLVCNSLCTQSTGPITSKTRYIYTLVERTAWV